MSVSVDIKTTGADKLKALAAAIKEAGDKNLRKEMYRAIGRTAKPLKKAGKDGALETLPKRGGLAERVASARFSARTRTAGKGAGVTITGSNGFDLPSLDRGRIRHKTYGHRPWVNQQTKPGWFTDALNKEAPTVQQELLKAIDEVAAKLESSV